MAVVTAVIFAAPIQLPGLLHADLLHAVDVLRPRGTASTRWKQWRGGMHDVEEKRPHNSTICMACVHVVCA